MGRVGIARPIVFNGMRINRRVHGVGTRYRGRQRIRHRRNDHGGFIHGKVDHQPRFTELVVRKINVQFTHLQQRAVFVNVLRSRDRHGVVRGKQTTRPPDFDVYN